MSLITVRPSVWSGSPLNDPCHGWMAEEGGKPLLWRHTPETALRDGIEYRDRCNLSAAVDASCPVGRERGDMRRLWWAMCGGTVDPTWGRP